jgi:DNA-binding SARP family transcriptional activator/WD40 repeat protein
VFLRVLGALSAEVGASPLPLQIPGAKERTLLGRLVAAGGRVVSVDVLADDLWDGNPPPTARKSLQAHVVRLRSALEPQRPLGSPGRYVVRRGDGYALSLNPTDVDASLATAQAAAGRAALGHDPERARSLLLETEALWRGEPYADWPQAPWALAERQRLRAVRVAVRETRLDADLALGRHHEVVAELEGLLADDAAHEGWAARLMLALYRSGRQADALAVARRVRRELAQELGVDASPALRQMEQAVLEHAEEIQLRPRPITATPPAPLPAHDVCPYRGLSPYREADADVFYGRGSAIRTLLARAAAARLVVVSGPSGAGKSSLVLAGLLPKLAGGALPGSAGWRPVVITPGASPVDRLAALTPAGEDGHAAEPPSVLLVVDQLEELWTAGAGRDEREAFLDTIVGMLADGVIVRAVLTVRADHVGRLSEHAEIADAAADGMVLVPPLTESELREVVEEPARAAGLAVEPDLVDAVLRDVHGRPGALPLLSTALVATWERRRGSCLTLAGYLEAGGATAALARTAETALTSLDEPGQSLARRLLVRLAATGESGGVVRRRVPLAELGLDGADGEQRRGVVEAFVSRRLLTIDAGHLEVTHEALLTAWPRFAAWLAEDAMGRAVRTHLAPEARDWDAAGRPEDRLYRGARLAAAQEWLSRPDADPSPVEREFVAASTARSEAELAQAREQALRERAGRRRTRRLAAVLAVACVLALAAGGLAVQRQQQADEGALRSDANRLAAASANAPALDTSLLLAAQAYRTLRTPETEDGLLAADVRYRQVGRIYRAAGIARHVAVAPDRRTLYAHARQEVAAWDLATGLRQVLLRYPSVDAYPTDVETNPATAGRHAGSVAVVVPPDPAGGSSTVRLLEPDGRTRWTLGSDELGGWPLSAEFTADGRELWVEAVTGYGGPSPVDRVKAVDVGTGRVDATPFATPIPSLSPYDSWLSGIAKGAGRFLVGDASNEQVGVVDMRTRRTTWLNLEGRAVSQVQLVEGGALGLAADGAMHWYPHGATRATQELRDHASQVGAVATDAAGGVLVSAGTDRRVVVHKMQADGRWASADVLTGHQGNVLDVAVSADGSRAYSTSEDQTIVEWDLTDRFRFGRIIPQVRDPASPTGLPAIQGAASLVGSPPLLVVPVFHGTSPGPQGEWHTAAVFIDPGNGAVTDWVNLRTAPESAGVPPAAVAVSPDGGRIAVTAQFATSVLEASTHHPLAVFALPLVDGTAYGLAGPVPEPVRAAAWSKDGSRLLLGTGGFGASAAATGRGAVVVVDTKTWRPLRRLLDGAAVTTVVASPDGRSLAVGQGSRVVVLDAATYTVRRTLAATGPVASTAFSRDSSWLAAVGGSKRLDVWDVWSGRPVLADAPYFAGEGASVGWKDRSTVIYGGTDGRGVLFDVDRAVVRGVPLPIFRDGGGGQVLVAPSMGSEVALLPGWREDGGATLKEGVVYSVDPADWLARVCDVVGRDLTAAEWATYEPGLPYQRTCTDLAARR